MEEDIKSFLNYLSGEKRYSPNTLAAYKSDLHQLAAQIQPQGSKESLNPSPGWLSADSLSGYMRSLNERKYTPSTVARKVAAAKSFLKFMVDTGRISVDLTPGLAPPQVHKPLPKPLSVSEVRHLLAEPRKLSGLEAKRDRAMLELLYATGLRASELMALNMQDVDLVSGSVSCSRQSPRIRTVPIDPYIVETVSEYVNAARPVLLSNDNEQALFLNRRGERLTRQGFWQIVQGYADKAGLGKKVTPRSLRHSFAAHKLRAGADLQSVQQLMGHAHISTTRTYSQVKMLS